MDTFKKQLKTHLYLFLLCGVLRLYALFLLWSTLWWLLNDAIYVNKVTYLLTYQSPWSVLIGFTGQVLHSIAWIGTKHSGSRQVGENAISFEKFLFLQKEVKIVNESHLMFCTGWWKPCIKVEYSVEWFNYSIQCWNGVWDELLYSPSILQLFSTGWKNFNASDYCDLGGIS